MLAVEDLAVNAYWRAHRAGLDASLGVATGAFVTLVEACRYREAMDLLRAVTGGG